jgi:hypothetical protein
MNIKKFKHSDENNDGKLASLDNHVTSGNLFINK